MRHSRYLHVYDGIVVVRFASDDERVLRPQPHAEHHSAGISILDGDFNGDGLADLYISGFGSHIAYGKRDRNLELVRHDSYADSRSAAIGDFNGDGFDDLVQSATPPEGMRHRAGGGLVVFHGSADGLSNDVSASLRPPDDVAAFQEDDHRFFGSLTVESGDVNGDGFDDVLHVYLQQMLERPSELSPGITNVYERSAIAMWAGSPDGISERVTAIIEHDDPFPTDEAFANYAGDASDPLSMYDEDYYEEQEEVNRLRVLSAPWEANLFRMWRNLHDRDRVLICARAGEGEGRIPAFWEYRFENGAFQKRVVPLNGQSCSTYRTADIDRDGYDEVIRSQPSHREVLAIDQGTESGPQPGEILARQLWPDVTEEERFAIGRRHLFGEQVYGATGYALWFGYPLVRPQPDEYYYPPGDHRDFVIVERANDSYRITDSFRVDIPEPHRQGEEVTQEEIEAARARVPPEQLDE